MKQRLPVRNPHVKTFLVSFFSLLAIVTSAQVVNTTHPGTGPYSSIQAAIDAPATVANDVISVGAGVYDEDVTVSKSLIITGAGAATTTIRGVINGGSSTISIAASSVEISGFTITRLGNNTTDWSNGLNLAGISVQGAISGMHIHDNIITRNRNAIDINNSSGHLIHNNIITNNRTGVICRNQTDNLTFKENEITNNWTVGIVFLDASGGTNIPVQSAANSVFTNNNISGNWYGQIVDRQSGGLVPAPGTTNGKDFSGNWYGTFTPVVTTANTTEPGYDAQIPVEFGGSAVAPGGQPDIAGPASANFDYTPFLVFGNDANVEATAGWGTFGFQGSFASIRVTAAGSQVGAIARIQEGVNLGTDNVNVLAGTYNESVLVNKSLTIQGAKFGVLGKGRSGAESIVDPNSSTAHGFKIVTDNVTIDGFTITNSAAYPAASSERYGVVSIEKAGTGNFTGLKVINNIISRQYKAVNFNYTNNFEIGRNWLHGESDAYNYGCTWISSYGTSSTTGNIYNNDLDGYNSAIEVQGTLAQPVSDLTITLNRSTGSQYVFIGMQSSTIYRNSVLNVTVGTHVFIGGGCSNDVFSENFFDVGSSNGISVSNDFGAGVNSALTFNKNSITGHTNPGYYAIKVVPAAYTGTLAATCNWYGTNTVAAVAASISGPVEYTPYLTAGTDAGSDPLNGFQPAAPCSPPCALVVSASATNASCPSQNNGTATANVTSGGTGSYTYNWHGYVPGNLDGQNGWNGGIGGFTNYTPGDADVVTGVAHKGSQSWYFKKGYNSPGQGSPFSPSVASVGDLATGTAGNQSIIELSFKPAALEDGSRITVYEGSVARNDRTGANLYVENIAGGLVSLYMYRSDDEEANGYSLLVNIGTYPANVWNTVKMITDYPPANNNDRTTWGTTRYYVNGVLVTTETTWPHWWRFKSGFAYSPGSSIKFTNNNAGAGFYIDDVSMIVNNTNTAQTVASFGAGFEPSPGTTQTISNLTPGIYAVTVTDANGCSGTATATVAATGIVHNTNTGLNYCTIQAAIDDAATLNGHNITIDAGTFNENVVVNKSLTLTGAGTGVTILTPSVACTGDGMNITASNVNVSHLTITNYTYGIRTSGTTISLYDVASNANCQYGITTGNGTNGLSILKSKFNSNTVGGWRAGTADEVSNVTVDSSEMKSNGVGANNGFGAFIAATTSATNVFDHITIKNSDFSDNLKKGLYFEKLNHALIDNVIINNSGNDPVYGFNNGIDINLKYDAYTDIVIQNSSITNSGALGNASDVRSPAAVTIKARDDSPSYNTDPATLTGFVFKNNIVRGPVNGLRLGEFGKTNAGPAGNTVFENSFGNMYSNKAILNETAAPLTAECNWFGTTSAPAIAALVSGAVDYTPYLTNGTDNNATTGGFQPVPNSCLNYYTISASAGANGAISPAGDVTVISGSSQTFTITANPCYQIATVLVDNVNNPAAVSSGTYTFTNVTAPHTIQATFTQLSYTINSSAGANGTITPNGATTVNCGTNRSYTIAPAPGYNVQNVIVDGASQGAITSYTFNSVTTNHTISATFVANAYTINASAGTNGSISPSGAVSVTSGSNQSFTITPNACYQRATVLVDGVNNPAAVSSGTYTFTNVTASHTISATFSLLSYTISSSAGPNGSISPLGATVVNCGANRTYTITPAGGYTVQNVIVDGAPQGPITSYTFTNVTTNHSISATFVAGGPVTSGILEAEFAALSGTIVSSNNAGYTGTGFGDYINNTGDYIEWTLNKSSAALVSLNFRYANGGSYSRPLRLEVNGAVVSPNLAFLPTGSWTTWAASQFTVNLVSGANKIRLTTNGSNGANVDHLAWRDTTINTSQTSGTLEAELALLSGAVVGSTEPGFTGTGYADYTNSTGDYIEWTLNKSSAVQVSLNFRYALGGSFGRPLRLEVNGTVLSASLAFPATGTWSNWSTTQFTANLIAGANKIRLTTIGSNGPNVDHLAWQDVAPLSGILEAELALLSGAAVASNYPGYTGSGFADYANNTGDYIEWTLNKPSATPVSLNFRYMLGGSFGRPLRLEVNGVVVAASLAFPPTGPTWTTWSTVQFTANLIAGANKIRLTTIGSNGPNVDHLAWNNVSGSRIALQPIVASPLQLSKSFTVNVSPNPSISSFNLFVESGNKKARISLVVTDVSGRILEANNNVATGRKIQIGSQYRPGIYFVRIMQGVNQQIVKVIKAGN